MSKPVTTVRPSFALLLSTLAIATTLALPGRAAAVPRETARAVAEILADYERIRGALSDDSSAGIPEASRRIARKARAARGGAPAALGAHLGDLATAANRLARVSNDEMPALRLAFGEVSRRLVAILSSDASLREGLHIFECPMTDGYGKWVQPAARRANPYMGRRMLTCGRTSTW